MPRYSPYVRINGTPRLINRVLEINSCHVPLADIEKFSGWSHLVAEYEGGWLFHLDVRDEGNIILQHETQDEVEAHGPPAHKITRDGKPVALVELNAGDSVRITTEVVDGVETAVTIIAKTMA